MYIKAYLDYQFRVGSIFENEYSDLRFYFLVKTDDYMYAYVSNKDLSNAGLNYTGMALILVSTFIYLFIRPTLPQTNRRVITEARPSAGVIDYGTIEPSADELQSSLLSTNSVKAEYDLFAKIGPKTKQIIGFFIAIFAGICSGQTTTPLLLTIRTYPQSMYWNWTILNDLYS